MFMDRAAKARKSERGKAAYAASKASGESALLRLDKGSLARLDGARVGLGLSRSAFAQIYLLPIAEALAERLPEIDAACRARGFSIATLVRQALSSELAREAAEPAGAEAAAEFDDLFG